MKSRKSSRKGSRKGSRKSSRKIRKRSSKKRKSSIKIKKNLKRPSDNIAKKFRKQMCFINNDAPLSVVKDSMVYGNKKFKEESWDSFANSGTFLYDYVSMYMIKKHKKHVNWDCFVWRALPKDIKKKLGPKSKFEKK